jgi:hypothetical protein
MNVREYQRGNKKGESRETVNIEKQNKNNTICVGHHYAQKNTNNFNKKCTLPQTTGGKNESNIIYMLIS